MDSTLNGGKPNPLGVFRRDVSARTAGAVTAQNGSYKITDTATTAQVGDIYRPETATNSVMVKKEYKVIEVPDANSFVIASKIAPTLGDTFFLLAEVTPQLSSAGIPQVTVDTTGLATSALQTAGNASLSSIDTKTPTVGQKTMAASSPVVIASDQSSIPVTLQAGTAIVGKVGIDQTTPGTTNLVALAANQSVNQTQINGVAVSVGAGNSDTGTMRVVVATNQGALPVTQAAVVSTVNSSTATLGIGAVFTGTAESSKDYSVIVVNVFTDQASAALGFSFQQSSNGTNWDITDVFTVPASTGKTYSFAPAASFYRIVYTNGAVANTVFRLQTVLHYNYTKPSSHSLADTITLQNDAELSIAQMRATNGTNAVPLLADASGNLQVVSVAGTAIIGKVGIDQTTPGTTNLVAANNTQVNGVAMLAGNGVTGTGSQRVTIASDNTAFAVNANLQAGTNKIGTVSQAGKTAITKTRNDYTSVSVTTAAYTQLIASTSAAISEIEIFDSSGQTLVLATGAAAAEVDQIYILPGGNGRVPLTIPISTRVSIKAVSANATVGESSINYYSV